MKPRSHLHGAEELRAARRQSRGLYWFVALFSFFANLLMLTGPLYMLQVYDRVLGSRSEQTLVALSLLVVFLYGVMGILDYTRGRVMSRAGARFQEALDQRVFDAMVRRSAVAQDPVAQTGLADLESVQRFIASPVAMAIFDLPWTPIFLFAIAIFHPWLGLLAVGGGVLLIGITGFNQLFSRKPALNAAIANNRAGKMGDEIRTEAETIQSMGMRRAAFDRWRKARVTSLTEGLTAGDVMGRFSTLTKTLRLFLQSAMLGLGAYLVLQGELTPGAMIAASILMGRALAPVEMIVNQWQVVQRSLKGWSSLSELLEKAPPENKRMDLPKPKAKLDVQSLTVVPPGDTRAQLKTVSFTVQPGQAIGVIGPSGSGKSTLARALTGVWRPAGGTVRLDGAALDQYDPDVLGQHIGYLPQRVQLFEGTIAENIARLSGKPDAKKVVEAATKAAVHDMILQLPDGYDTHITAGGGRLSGGQMQRVGLARALYDDPVIVILDEPNSSLDNDGSVALNKAIRSLKEAGKSVLIMAHRPAAIAECDMLLVLDHGVRMAFGPKDQVLKEMVTNHQVIKGNKTMGGVR
ncbi:type I secretion system permease/ATPase [Ruegeria pomeroyi]|uniref:Type I secretion system ATPase n=2 Tax=Ruegeria pomeroyi TaxID=89184 RepID=Q5LM36_RUEPO|nr:type I secretion system permease/ATPase [Ruegeria pomeroyi]HCE72772.1 type I secretion system permease/ATPase [Ruegeria sp.]AAV96949.1 type I secretion system ATPase [Ruegeria pomeroyi DSS-3]NVK97995.1 type I secretion system permease/ATPase [Ruegeria pomeroyi]NVL02434.1 type I secretion system permease/ATPase [Ruegeria pomeroyi]QWV10478.1 type I secretion system permease/ATPase [Ruegeria pomeroyi]